MVEKTADLDPNNRLLMFVDADGYAVQPQLTADGKLPVEASFSGSITVEEDNSAGILAALQPVSALTTAQVDMAATEAQIIAASSTRKTVMITNIGAKTVYIGNTGVLSTTGGGLLAGVTKVYDLTCALYGICANGETSRVSTEAV